jgi:hypothetical protein
MALSNINITTNTGLALKVNDFVLMMSSDGVTTSTTTTTTTAATTSTTTTTTTAASFVLLAPVGGLAGTSSAACLNYLSSRSYYSTLNGFVSGVTTIYEDSSLTTPFNSGGQWKPMSFDGINIYAVITDSAGVVTTYTSC